MSSTTVTSSPTAIRPGAVLADLLPAVGSRSRAFARDAALVAGGAALTGLAAQIAVPIPGTPVPVTGQTFAVLLLGAALGARRSFASLALYALVGMAGVPWFAGGGSGAGFASFGYVLAYLAAAPLVGALARRGADRTPLRTAGAMVLGNLAIYAIGVPYLAIALHVGAGKALALGMVPFLIGDAVKAVLAMGLLPTAWKLAARR
jgi:biotin transport system substrate-specific component